MKDLEIKANIGQVARGRYKLAVCDGKTGRVKWEMPDFKPNLILNNGLQQVASYHWVQCMTYAYAGTGTTSNYKDSGTDTASSDASGNVTSVGATIDFTADAANGDCILWDSGETGRITSRPTANTCTITPAPGGAGISSGEFTVLYTTRTQLDTPARKVATYLAGAPHQVSQRIGNIVILRNTYDFAVEAGGGVAVSEIGLGPISFTPPANGNIFSRISVSPVINIADGEYLRLVYQLEITITPTAVTAAAPSVTGWPVAPATVTDGDYGIFNVGLGTVNVGTASVGLTTIRSTFDSYANEPSTNLGNPNISPGSYRMWVSGTRLGFGGYSWPQNGTARADYLLATNITGQITDTDFTGLTYSQVKSAKWAIGEGNIDSYGGIAAVGFGYYSTAVGQESDPTVACGLVFEFDEDQTKTNLQTMLLSIKYSWSRTLTID
ncbi:MAG: hypothetical protein ACYSUV_02010 [Planctomycetota bacterium]|jgi:hypothetical protein